MLKAEPNIPKLSQPYKTPYGWRVDLIFAYGIVQSHYEKTRYLARKYYHKAKERYGD